MVQRYSTRLTKQERNTIKSARRMAKSTGVPESAKYLTAVKQQREVTR